MAQVCGLVQAVCVGSRSEDSEHQSPGLRVSGSGQRCKIAFLNFALPRPCQAIPLMVCVKASHSHASVLLFQAFLLCCSKASVPLNVPSPHPPLAFRNHPSAD